MTRSDDIVRYIDAELAANPLIVIKRADECWRCSGRIDPQRQNDVDLCFKCLIEMRRDETVKPVTETERQGDPDGPVATPNRNPHLERITQEIVWVCQRSYPIEGWMINHNGEYTLRFAGGQRLTIPEPMLWANTTVVDCAGGGRARVFYLDDEWENDIRRAGEYE